MDHSTTTRTTTAADEKKRPEELKESAFQIWLAGLGALASAGEEGAKAFNRLVDRGREIEAASRERAETFNLLVDQSPEAERDARFSVPSGELTLQMLNVPLREWKGEDGQSPEDVLHRVTEDLQEDLLATLADLAFAARERGESTVSLSVSGRFNDRFVRELMRTLPIDPYIAPEVLRGLHDELLGLARSGSVQASWGRLTERDGDLEVLLPQRDSRLAEAFSRGTTTLD